MKISLTIFLLCSIIFCNGCFLSFRSQELNLDAGSGLHSDNKLLETTNSETKGGE